MKRSPKPMATASAWRTSASASARRPPPSARAIADEIPPPIAPADIICISISTGNTRVTPASASVPSFAMKYVSMSPTAAWANITSTLGAASRSSVPTMDPSRSRRVRGSNRRILGSGASTSLRASLSTKSAWRTSASMRLLPVERHARRRRAGHEALLIVGDVTLDEAHRLPAFHEAPEGPELGVPHGLQEIDLQLDGREGLAFRQRACVGDAHGRIGDVAEHAAVKCAHRIRVLPARRQLDHRLAGRDRGQRESDQRRDGGRGTLIGFTLTAVSPGEAVIE